MSKKYNSALILIILPLMLISAFIFSSCDDAGVILPVVTTTEVAAKDRLDSANAQATRKYGAGTSLVLIFGKNVKSNGKADLVNTTNIDSIGAWLYVYRAANDTLSPFKIYTPNPLPTTTDCIELSTFFDVNAVIGLVQDTTVKNEISSALFIVFQTGISITTPTGTLLNSDAALTLAASTSPVIKFNSSYALSSSTINGNVFNSSGSSQTTNMFLIPAAGTLNIGGINPLLTGFPNDLWVVNYRKLNSSNVTENLVLGTEVTSGTTMTIPGGTSSPVINLSKDAQ